MPLAITFSPNVPQPSQNMYDAAGWQSAWINNQSNCWFFYGNQVLAVPWQQLVYSFPSGDPNPSLSLSSTAPQGQQSQPQPAGMCYVTLYEEQQAGQIGGGGGGAVTAQQTVVQNEQVLATINVPVGASSQVTLVTVPPWLHTLVLINGSAGPLDISNRTVQYTVEGQQTGTFYVTTTKLAKGDQQAASIDPAADQVLIVTISDAGGMTRNTTITVVGSPFSTLPINVDVTGGSVTVLPTPTFATDVSATLTSGGTSQTLVGFDSTRHWIVVVNPVTETENVGVNFTGGAAKLTAGDGSYILPPGKGLSMPLDNTVSWIATTMGHTLSATVG